MYDRVKHCIFIKIEENLILNLLRNISHIIVGLINKYKNFHCSSIYHLRVLSFIQTIPQMVNSYTKSYTE